MKAKYKATFSNGETITRTSEHNYLAAWQASYRTVDWHRTADGKATGDYTVTDEVRTVTGFAKDANSVSAFRPVIPLSRGMSSANRKRQAARNEKLLSDMGYKVEIVEAVKQ